MKVLACALVLVSCACREGGPAPADAGIAASAAPQAAAPPARPALVIPPPQGRFDAAKLHCDALLPAGVAAPHLGFAPQLLERQSRRDGHAALLCTHRTQRVEETLSFQVVCGGKETPAGFDRLHKLLASATGSRPSPLGKRGIATATSILFLHPHRPCFVQVAGRGAARTPDALERLALQIASAVP